MHAPDNRRPVVTIGSRVVEEEAPVPAAALPDKPSSSTPRGWPVRPVDRLDDRTCRRQLVVERDDVGEGRVSNECITANAEPITCARVPTPRRREGRVAHTIVEHDVHVGGRGAAVRKAWASEVGDALRPGDGTSQRGDVGIEIDNRIKRGISDHGHKRRGKRDAVREPDRIIVEAELEWRRE